MEAKEARVVIMFFKTIRVGCLVAKIWEAMMVIMVFKATMVECLIAKIWEAK